MKDQIKVIWIDDDINLLNDAEPVFNDYGFDIIKCTSIAQGLKCINEGQADNLLLDIDFPNSPKEGIVFLNELRNIKPNLKVVIFTGFPDSNDTVKSIRDLYAADYIEKPIPSNPSQLHFFFDRLKEAFYRKSNINMKLESSDTFKLNKLMILLIFIIGLLAAIGGIIAIIISKDSETSVKLFGQEMKTILLEWLLFSLVDF